MKKELDHDDYNVFEDYKKLHNRHKITWHKIGLCQMEKLDVVKHLWTRGLIKTVTFWNLDFTCNKLVYILHAIVTYLESTFLYIIIVHGSVNILEP
jgi:hypothetical protein